MGVNGVYGPFNTDQKIKLQNRGANSGITFELKSVFDQMAKDGLIKDTDGKGLTKTDAQNMYEVLNKMHQETGRATNYTKMQVGQEFTYTADEMKALAQAAGYEVVEQAPLEEDIVPEEELNQEEVTPQEELPLQDEPGEIVEPETPQEELVTGPKEGENPEYDKAVKGDDGVEDLSTKPEKEPVNNEDKSMRELRKEAREQNRLERREDRIERKEARQAGRELRKNLREAEADFAANGQVGKIVNGKYYINGKETTKENFEMAKIKSDAAQLNNEVKDDKKDTEVKGFKPQPRNQKSQAELDAYLNSEFSASYRANYAEKEELNVKLSELKAEEAALNAEADKNFEAHNSRDIRDIAGAMRDFDKSMQNKNLSFEKGQEVREVELQYWLLNSACTNYSNTIQNWTDGMKNIANTSHTMTSYTEVTLESGEHCYKGPDGTLYQLNASGGVGKPHPNQDASIKEHKQYEERSLSNSNVSGSYFIDDLGNAIPNNVKVDGFDNEVIKFFRQEIMVPETKSSVRVYPRAELYTQNEFLNSDDIQKLRNFVQKFAFQSAVYKDIVGKEKIFGVPLTESEQAFVDNYTAMLKDYKIGINEQGELYDLTR